MDADTVQKLISDVRQEKECPDPGHPLNFFDREHLNAVIAWLERLNVER